MNHLNHIAYTRNEWNGEYFKSVVSYLRGAKIKSFVDIGANTGEVANILIEGIPTIEEIYLVEPSKSNYDFIIKNVRCSNKICILAAIFYGEKQCELYQHPDYFNVGGYTISPIINNCELTKKFVSTNEKADTTTLEEFITHVDFIKIDTEGCEYNIIEHSSVVKEAKYLEIEFHDNNEHKDIKGFINKHLPNHEIVFSKDGNYFLKHGN